MNGELKPCPFCGGAAVVKAIEWDSADACWWVECSRCGGHTDEYLAETAEHATEAWNRRAEQPFPEPLTVQAESATLDAEGGAHTAEDWGARIREGRPMTDRETIGHLLDVLGTEWRTRCPWLLPLLAYQAGQWWAKSAERWEPYLAAVDSVCGCRSEAGCPASDSNDVAARCWRKFLESNPPAWWWSYQNPPKAEEPAQETLF